MLEPLVDYHRLQFDDLRNFSHAIGNSVFDSRLLLGARRKCLSCFSFVRPAQFLRTLGVPGGSPQRTTGTGFDGQPGVGFSVEQYRSGVGAFYDLPRDNFSVALGGDCRHAGQRWRALFQLSHGAFISSLGLSYGCGAHDRLAPGFLGQPQTQFSLAGSGLAVGWRRLVYLEGPRLLAVVGVYIARLRGSHNLL